MLRSLPATLTVVVISIIGASCGGTDSGATAATAVDEVTVAGDSISVGLGALLREEVDDGVEVRVVGEEGTGLARADGVDWPARLEQIAAGSPPDVVVLSLGSNDAQDLVSPAGEVVAPLADDAAWDAEYSRRLARAFDAFEGTGTTVVWVGHVRTREDRVGRHNRRVHRLAEDVATERGWVEVRDLAEMLGTGEEVAEECLIADGLHLSADCLRLAAARLATQPPVGSAG